MPDDGLGLCPPLEFLLGLKGKGEAHKQFQPLPQALPAAGHEVCQQVQSCLHTHAQRRSLSCSTVAQEELETYIMVSSPVKCRRDCKMFPNCAFLHFKCL